MTTGAIVGGPENGFPVTLIAAPGTGLTRDTTVQMPSTYPPFVPTTADETAMSAVNAVSPGPLSEFSVARQSLHAIDFFTADRGGTILITSPDIVRLSGCE